MSDKRPILIVEDDDPLRETLREHLADEHGFAIHTAATLREADRAINQEDIRIDAIILDIGLPVMDGYELARRFRDNPALKQVKLVAVTGASNLLGTRPDVPAIAELVHAVGARLLQHVVGPAHQRRPATNLRQPAAVTHAPPAACGGATPTGTSPRARDSLKGCNRM